ncbi:hypothetical protein F4777DRAFT_441100 [Nemania sp. FL0916]|nr:hypothetical protein F4777DRAFT_441100 [Nemania sp. FL0916]
MQRRLIDSLFSQTSASATLASFLLLQSWLATYVIELGRAFVSALQIPRYGIDGWPVKLTVACPCLRVLERRWLMRASTSARHSIQLQLTRSHDIHTQHRPKHRPRGQDSRSRRSDLSGPSICSEWPISPPPFAVQARKCEPRGLATKLGFLEADSFFYDNFPFSDRQTTIKYPACKI